jgi:Cu/Ag efflux protein CusF
LAVGFLVGRRFPGRINSINRGFYFTHPAYGFGRRGEKMFGNRNYSSFYGYLEVVKNDGKKLTVKLPDGSTQEVNLSSDSVVYTQSKGSLDDIKEGDKVIIRGNSAFGQTIIVQK